MLCCLVEGTGVCNDPMPGDLVAAGTCSNDALLPCDTDVDCTKTRSAVSKDEAACTAAGGTCRARGRQRL